MIILSIPIDLDRISILTNIRKLFKMLINAYSTYINQYRINNKWPRGYERKGKALVNLDRID